VPDDFFSAVEVQPTISTLTINADPIHNDVGMGSGLALKLCVIVQHYYILIHIHPQSIK
jgi:hypothetical protein